MSYLEQGAEAAGGAVTVPSLMAWLCARAPRKLWASDDDDGGEDVVDALREELYIVAEHFFGESARGTMDGPSNAEDPEEESLRVARGLAEPQLGWPLVSGEPTLPREPGRFAKSHPLEFPMGIADLHDDRVLKVSPAEWVQHMLRYHTGHFVHGLRGHRVVWAMVNTLLMGEAAGKGFAVHRNVLRRQGGRLRGAELLTKGRLREMLEDEQAVRSLVHPCPPWLSLTHMSR